MNPLLHAFRTTFRRFRWEILAFWLFSAALTVGLLSGKITGLSFEERYYGGPREAPPYGNIEIIAAMWLTLRLMFSEPALLTQGGWKTRPMGRRVILLAPFTVLAAVVLPAVLLRSLPIQMAAAPDAAGWWRIAKETFLPALGILGGIALVMRAAGSLLPRRNPGWGKKIAFAGICLAAMAACYNFAVLRRGGYSMSNGGNWGSGGTMNYSQAVLGIQRQLEPGGTYIGDWMTISPPAPAMRVLCRLPLKTGSATSVPGLRIEITGIEPVKNQLDVRVRSTVAGSGMHRDLTSGVMVLRYAGNSYAFRRQNLLKETPPATPLYPLWSAQETSRFDSPIDRSWNTRGWDELLADAELILFTYDRDQEPIRSLDGLVHPPEEAPKKREPGLAGEVTEIFNDLDFANEGYGDPRQKRARQAAKDLPVEAKPYIFAQRIWSGATWDAVVKPFLLKHAGDPDRAILLERMTKEPRLGEIFIAKGWKAEAMPLLRGFAKDRLPLDAVCLSALLDEKDPELADDLAILIERLPGNTGELEPKMKVYPGFDWANFVQRGWRSRKYSYRQKGNIAPFDVWAAELGDATAFMFVAERAARREEGYGAKLRELLAVAVEDPVALVRANLGQMRYDATSQRWRAADPKP